MASDNESRRLESAFLNACQDCDEERLKELIKEGLNKKEVNYADRSEKTGLAYAASSGFLPVLRLLENMQELIDVNQADNEGTTPLMFAAQAGHYEVVNFLLTNYKGVEIDKRDYGGFTALIKAAIQGRARSAKMLILSGASTDLRDFRRGFCAAEWALFCGRHMCSSLIMRLADQLEAVRRCTDEMYKVSGVKCSSDPDLSRCSSLGAMDLDKKHIKKNKKMLSTKIKKGAKKKSKSEHILATNGYGGLRNEDRTISELVFSSSCLSYSGLPSNSTPPSSPLFSRIASWATRTSRKQGFVVPKVLVTKPADESGFSRRLNAILSPPSSRRRRIPKDPLAVGRSSSSSSSEDDDD
ncbi:uncharacterized protein LOC100373201 [Saccoglossus kowalevskii]|uniref:Ankyrin repeat domain-containing protein 17-like n=1 Tax=Saccoglossus kowalevskii TaxID=10224 RepID=A0ABM0GKP0_SACKO|nr:PREDICTED: ankyrin repeat domain-containing protein 17-like [Saccoglossus kowalevskii]